MSIDLTAGIVRILTSEGETAGTGFVVTDNGLIATCAHVVKAAGAGPGDSVRMIFHSTGEGQDARVESEWWRDPGGEDVAILRLEGSPPEGVISLPLGSSAGVEGYTATTFGFPDAKPVEGMAGKCEVVGRTTQQSFPVLQLRSTEVSPGFSGAPVLDTVTRRVVGMVTSITVLDRYGRLGETAFITPTETLWAVCPVLRLSDLCPYQGLAAFTEDLAEFFFGRDKLVADLVDHLRGSPRFLAVVGPSGSGKSSVVRAGLFPAMERGEVPGSEEWHPLPFRPGPDPFAALTTAGLDVPQKGDLPAAVRAFLETHPQVKRLVLFADQFEELFTLCPQPVQERFLRQLAALLDSNLRVTVILALRADFYGHLLRYRPLVDWLKIGQVNVPPMGPEELRAAVEEPATRLDLRFEPGLVETIVKEAYAADHPLPLLESALTRLWERREDGVLTHPAYQAVGRVAGAIGQWAEDAYTELSREERSLTRRIFTRLVRYGEGEVADTRLQQSMSELVALSEEQEPLHRLVRQLADARLLVTGGDPGAETVEIIHDALLQQWGRLKQWTAEQREFYLWRQRLDERLQEWKEKGQDEGALLRGALLAEAERWLAERREELNRDEQAYIRESVALREREQMVREQRQRRLTLAAVGTAVVFSVLAFLAWGQWNAAFDAQATAASEANIRATAQAQAELEADVRATAQAQAELEAGVRATAQVKEETQAQIALARQLATQARLVMDQYPDQLHRAMLLSIESLRRNPEIAASQVLCEGLGITPKEIARMKHDEWVTDIAFSCDGQLVVSGSADSTARVWETTTGQEIARMMHEGHVDTVDLSPDGRWVVSGSKDGTARVWEATTGYEISRMTHEESVDTVAFSPDGRWVVSGGEDGTARVWEAATGREIARKTHDQWVTAAAFSLDGQWVVSGDDSGRAWVWEAATGHEVAQHINQDRESYGVIDVAFSPDRKWIVSAGCDNRGAVTGICGIGSARVWEAETGREITQVTHNGEVEDVTFSPNGQWIVSRGGATARVWEAATGREIARMVHMGGMGKAVFSPDGQWVVSSGGRMVRVWEAATGREIARMMHEGRAGAVIFSPDGREVASTDEETLRVWKVATGRQIARMKLDDIRCLAFSPDKERVVAGNENGILKVWETTTGRGLVQIVSDSSVMDVAFSPNGEYLLSGGLDGSVQVWEATTGREIARMEHYWDVEGIVLNAVETVAFSPNGKRVVSGSEDHTGRVWEAATGREVARVMHDWAVTSVAFSPDGRWVVSVEGKLPRSEMGSMTYTRVWEASTGLETVEMKHSSGFLEAAFADFSPDGRWVVSVSGGLGLVWEVSTGREIARFDHVSVVDFSPDGQWLIGGEFCRPYETCDTRVWEVSTGREVAHLTHDHTVSAVAFSSDGQWVISGDSDGVARVWNANTGHELAKMIHNDLILDVAFGLDGQWVVSGSEDGTIQTWLWQPEDLIELACNCITRNLSRDEWQQYVGDEPYRPTCPNLPVPEE